VRELEYYDYLLFVHTYGAPVAAIAQALRAVRRHRAFFVAHVATEPFGILCGGDGFYDWDPARLPQVQTNFADNGVYQNDNPLWLFQGVAGIASTLLRKFGDTYLFQLDSLPDLVPFAPMYVPLDLDSALQSDSPNLVRLNGAEQNFSLRNSTAYKNFDCTIDVSYSFRDWVWATRNGTTRVAVPKALVNAVATSIAGRARTTKTFESCLALAKRRAMNYQLHDSMRAESVFLATVLGFSVHADKEGSRVNAMLWDHGRSFDRINRALEFRWWWTFNWRWFGAAVACFAAAAALIYLSCTIGFGPPAPEPPHPLFVLSNRMILTLWCGAFSAIGLAVLTHFSGKIQAARACLDQQAMDLYARERIVPVQPPTNSSVHPPVPMERHVSVLKTDTSAEPPSLLRVDGKFTPASDPRPYVESPGAYAVGVVLPNVPPTVFATDSHNLEVAVKSRVLLQTPAIDETLHSRMRQWVRANRDALFPPEVVLLFKSEDYTYQAWVARDQVTAGQRMALDDGHDQTDADPSFATSDSARKTDIFVKVEVSVQDTVVDDAAATKDACPRIIQAGRPAFRSVVGPISWRLSKVLAQCWNGRRPNNIYWPIGASQVQIGDFVSTASCDLSGETGAIYRDSDTSRHDSHNLRPHKEMALECASFLGASTEEVALLRQDLDASGVGFDGSSFSCQGTTQTGRDETSYLNTLVTCLATQFAQAIIDSPLPIEVACLAHSQLKTQHKLALDHFELVGGDDDASIVRRTSAMPGRFKSIKELLGWTITVHCSERLVDFEFFSSWFCRAELNGEVVLALTPKLGRVFAKSGWSCDPRAATRDREAALSSALSQATLCRHVAPLRALFDKIVSLTRGRRALPEKKGLRTFVPGDSLDACAETVRDLCSRYGVDQDALVDLISTIMSIRSIPCTMSHPAVDAFVLRDIGL
jgi:hypothetical protein